MGEKLAEKISKFPSNKNKFLNPNIKTKNPHFKKPPLKKNNNYSINNSNNNYYISNNFHSNYNIKRLVRIILIILLIIRLSIITPIRKVLLKDHSMCK